MKIKTLAAVAAFAILSVAGAADAQVVALVNEETGGCFSVDSLPSVYATATAKAQRQWGTNGYKIFATSRPGNGAMFVLVNQKTGKPHFFHRHGYESSEEAIKLAREDTYKFARQNGITSTPSICGQWNNTNRYSLDTLPSDGEF